MQTNILLDNNAHIRKYTGVQKFHDAGYFGGRVTAGTLENWPLKAYNPDGLVSDPLGVGTVWDDHAVWTAACFFQAAPKARLVMLKEGGRYFADGTYESRLLDTALPEAERLGVASLFSSLFHSGNKAEFAAISARLGALPGLKFFACAGNSDKESYNRLLDVPEVTGVAAYTMIVTGTMNPARYSSESEHVDFAAPSMIYFKIDAKAPAEQGQAHSGTSFSAPWLCGMACLVDDFFIDKTGRPLSRDAMMRFFRDHTVDIGKEGFDAACGHGAVVLPDPAEIDVWKYQTKEETDMYKDQNEIPAWAEKDILYCCEHGLMQGDADGAFRPHDTLTRAEAACVAARLHRAAKGE